MKDKSRATLSRIAKRVHRAKPCATSHKRPVLAGSEQEEHERLAHGLLTAAVLDDADGLHTLAATLDAATARTLVAHLAHMAADQRKHASATPSRATDTQSLRLLAEHPCAHLGDLVNA